MLICTDSSITEEMRLNEKQKLSLHFNRINEKLAITQSYKGMVFVPIFWYLLYIGSVVYIGSIGIGSG